MSKRELTTIRILMFVAGLLAPTEWRKELESIANHITVNLREEKL